MSNAFIILCVFNFYFGPLSFVAFLGVVRVGLGSCTEGTGSDTSEQGASRTARPFFSLRKCYFYMDGDDFKYDSVPFDVSFRFMSSTKATMKSFESKSGRTDNYPSFMFSERIERINSQSRGRSYAAWITEHGSIEDSENYCKL